eukprot:CAMPEP_0169117858 /NCGR_PEP_ID=MMETSP1015-20121227/30687_1 /TAXON_ID=342587 /ORGANISM="Karlodinium micrum, Strain CCMP2283" /LENGTH=147 /DNA_ID=CAMNT_0009180579 /DNA_START=66 /DNA_END=509 /DNA_ORIENTATION=-
MARLHMFLAVVAVCFLSAITLHGCGSSKETEATDDDSAAAGDEKLKAEEDLAKKAAQENQDGKGETQSGDTTASDADNGDTGKNSSSLVQEDQAKRMTFLEGKFKAKRRRGELHDIRALEVANKAKLLSLVQEANSSKSGAARSETN